MMRVAIDWAGYRRGVWTDQPTALPCGVFIAPLLRSVSIKATQAISMKRRDFVAGGVATVGVPLVGAPALADRKFPSKPIRLVVPFAPGSGSDFVGRLWAEKVRRISAPSLPLGSTADLDA
jgi:hypothetical protein